VRKILHIDMDAFYASVEQLDNPDLRGKPVIVAWQAKRSVVCAASYEARAFGVHSAMPAVRAERLCPGAVFVPPDFTRYRAVSHDVREIFKRHTDLIEPLSLDEAYLDVTKNKTGLPTATIVARTIREQIRQELNLTASAGVAPNKFLAKIASDWRKPDGLFVIQPDDVDAFLSPLPVGRLPGVGKVTGEKLATLKIQTVGDLKKLDSQVLEQHFGRYGLQLYELARGIDDNEVIPDRPTQSISVEDTFEHDVPLTETEPMIRRLTEKLWSASRTESRIASTVVLKLKTIAGTLAVTIPLYRLNMPHYQHLTWGVRGSAVVTALEPGNHQAVRYKFDAGGKTYSGVGRAGFGNPEFGSLSVGQTVVSYYDSDDPHQSCAGIPAELIRNEIPPILLAGVTFPAFALGVWSFRYPPLKRWLLK